MANEAFAMTAAELLRTGRLDDAIRTLGDELKASPLDTQRRSFLFELLCFAGQYDRAEKQLGILDRLAGTLSLVFCCTGLRFMRRAFGKALLRQPQRWTMWQDCPLLAG